MNGTASNKDPVTELTIVQDFHQVRSVSNSTGSDAPQDEHKAQKEAKPAPGIMNNLWNASMWFSENLYKKIQSLFEMKW